MGSSSNLNFNEAQKEAITFDSGPLMIIAGAGTGKTGVITSRILHLMNDKNIDPKNILALTFTEKSALEMEERVDRMMPLSYEKVFIGTFHSFCDSILREFGHYIGIDGSYKIINDAKQWMIIKNHIFSLDLDLYRPLNNPFKFINDLISNFNKLKDEYITPENYIDFVNIKMKSKNDPTEDEDLKIMHEIATTYDKYQKIKLQNGFLDFGDLQFYMLKLLNESPKVLTELKDRYKYILVDEYQDTNFAQNKIVLKLAGDNGNITVVGDDDQSIYKWRGASLTNIISFEKHFPKVKKIVLNKNYRSSQEILDLSYSVIKFNNPDRLEYRDGIDKKLISMVETENINKNELKNNNSEENDISEKNNTNIEENKPVGININHYSNYIQEAVDISNKIKDLSNNNNDYSNIAVLIRANQHATAFVDAFKSLNIPFNLRDTQSLTKYEEIKDLVSFLMFINKPHDDVAITRILSLEFFDIPMADVLDVVYKSKKDHHKPIFYYLRDLFKQDSLLVDDGFDRIKYVFNLLNNLLDFSRRENVYSIIGKFLYISGYYNFLKRDIDLNADKIKRISSFLEIASDDEFGVANTGISAFLDYLNSYDEAGGLKVDTDNDKNAVSVLTVHSAKGLEFDHVFVPCLVGQRFPSTNRKDKFLIPNELLEEEQIIEQNNISEERRLFYVACTRAKKTLHLSYSDKYEGAKKWKKSIFVEESLSSEIVKETDLTESSPNLIDNINPDFKDRTSVKSSKIINEKENKLENFIPEINVNRLSYSQIDSFSTCPLKYKFKYIFKIPSPTPHAANFGSSVHNTINNFYNKILGGEKHSVEMILDLFEKYWIPEGYINKAHENTRKLNGEEIIKNFYEFELKNGLKVPMFMEKSFTLKVSNVSLTGRIDRIDRLEDGTYEVIDYKTGTSKKDINLKKDTQLSLYALACRDVFKINASKYTLFYLDDLQKKSTTRNDEDIEKEKNELINTAEDIQKSTFEAKPGYHCKYCEYRMLCNKAQ